MQSINKSDSNNFPFSVSNDDKEPSDLILNFLTSSTIWLTPFGIQILSLKYFPNNSESK